MATVSEDATLRQWADALCRHHFGVPFDGEICWAPRLRCRAGEFHPSRMRIRISGPYRLAHGDAETQQVLLHELCHWWLFRQGIAHREDAAVFRDLLRRAGAPRRARPVPATAAHRYTYACPHCGRRYTYSRRVAYACGHCCRALGNGHWDPRFRLILC